MTKKIKWRLSSLPTPSELQGLVKDEIITKAEAREILLSREDVDERNNKSLKEEIKFLRELIEKLSSSNNTKIIETIKYIEKPYYSRPWFTPYNNWVYLSGSNGTTNLNNMNCSGTSLLTATTTDCSFSSIQTL